MTNPPPPDQPSAPPQPVPVDASSGRPSALSLTPGRTLASAVTVFLGGYLLLASFTGQLGTVAWGLFGGLTGRGSPGLPGGSMVLLVLQFLFAIAVVVVGLLIGKGSTLGKLLGASIVVVGSLLTFVHLGLRIVGLSPLPGGREGIPFQAVFANTWFALVLFVGVAWLISRRAKLGWLSLLGTVVLIPLPMAFAFANVESGVSQILMFLLSGLVGAGIILAGRPFRD